MYKRKIVFSIKCITKYWEICYITLYFLSTSNEVEKYVETMKSNSSDKYVHCYKTEILNLFDPELQLLILNLQLKTN